jgi:hypothetical protein
MLGGTWGFHIVGWQEGFWLKYFLVQLSLARENVVASWYSSMLLLLASLIFAACFFADRQLLTHRRTWFLNYGWIFLSLIFATLSFDEMGSFHEAIGETVAFNKAGSSLGLGEYAGWTVFVILIGAVGIFMLLFSWFRLKYTPWAIGLFILGVLLFLSNLLQERFEIESFWASQGDTSYRRPAFFLLLEEGSEILGSLCFIVSGALYATSAIRKWENGLSATETIKGQGIRGSISLDRSLVIIYSALIICFLGILMAIVEFFPMDIERVPTYRKNGRS